MRSQKRQNSNYRFRQQDISHFKIEDVFSLSQTRQYIKKEVHNFFFFWVKLFESTLFKLDPP